MSGSVWEEGGGRRKCQHTALLQPGRFRVGVAQWVRLEVSVCVCGGGNRRKAAALSPFFLRHMADLGVGVSATVPPSGWGWKLGGVGVIGGNGGGLLGRKSWVLYNHGMVLQTCILSLVQLGLDLADLKARRWVER